MIFFNPFTYIYYTHEYFLQVQSPGLFQKKIVITG